MCTILLSLTTTRAVFCRLHAPSPLRRTEPDNHNFSLERRFFHLRSHDFFRLCRRKTSRAGPNQWKGNGAEFSHRQLQRVFHGLSNGIFTCAPQKPYPRNVNNPPIRKFSCRRQHRLPQRQHSIAMKLDKRLMARLTLDGSGNTLRQKQPPRQKIAVPCVDNHLHGLLEQVSFFSLYHVR